MNTTNSANSTNNIKSIVLESGTHFFYEEIYPSHIKDPSQIILFIPGAYQTSWAFRDIVSKFSRENPQTIILIINLTFFGKSYNTNFSRETWGNVLEMILLKDLNLFYMWYKNNHKHIHTWDIFSYSFGTYCTLKWIFAYSPIIDKLILACPYGIFPNTGKWGMFMGSVFKYNMYGSLIQFCNYFLKYCNYIIEDHNHSCKIISNTFCLSKGYLTSCFLDKIHILSTMNISTYIIYGSEDVISPYEQANVVQMMFPESIKRCFVIHKTGHSDMIYNKEFLKILDFVFFNKRPSNTIQYIVSSWFPSITQKKITDYYLSL